MPDTPGLHAGEHNHPWDDRFLYPNLINQHKIQPPVRWWQRARHALAESLADPALATAQRREDRTLGIRLYQRELAHRSRHALINRVQDGWWLGPPPHGYALQHHRVQEHSGHSRWRHRLTVDQRTAPTVPIIYGWFVHEALTETAIVGRLVADLDKHPLPLDPVSGQPRPWTPARVRTVLTNPAYLGYVVWGRTHRGQPQPPGAWICSQRPSHPALVEPALFWAAYHRIHPITEPAVRRRSA